ncbi:MAG: methyltransferase domain-containing protein [Candidatus Omnitrophica bacterium]|nr:methyltransferase domain-containing protein [Candidatus Omnitrophota bacterium]
MRRLIHKIVNRLGFSLTKIKTKNEEYGLDLYRSLYGEESIQKRRFYNIGAGGFYHPAWTNIDLQSEWYKGHEEKVKTGINFDLMSLMPFPVKESTASLVYSSHTVEHITDAAAENMFKESFRILKDGGIFRLTCPNIDLYYEAYKRNDRHFFFWINTYTDPVRLAKKKIAKPMDTAPLGEIFLYDFAASVSPLHSDGATQRITVEELKTLFQKMKYEEVLNYCTSLCPVDIQKKYPGNHMNWWNLEKAQRMLKKTGFNKVYASSYGQSFSPVLRDVNFFDKTYPKISLYIEAQK